jgi:hypothetical protein
MSCESECGNYKTSGCAIWQKDHSLIVLKDPATCPHYSPKGMTTLGQPKILQTKALAPEIGQTSLTSTMPESSIIRKTETIDGRLKITTIHQKREAGKK